MAPPRPHCPLFFTVCLAARGLPALIDHLEILRHAVRETRRDRPFEILAWVVLPDHMHAVWRLPADDLNYSQRWGRIKARFSRDACRAGLLASPRAAARKGESGIWQQRFCEHYCRDRTDLERHIHYCWLDPVKHGLAATPTEWQATSIHRDIRLGRVAPDWAVMPVEGVFGEAA